MSNAAQVEARLIILAQFRDAVRAVSPKLYTNLKQRQDLSEIIIETMDDLEDELDLIRDKERKSAEDVW